MAYELGWPIKDRPERTAKIMAARMRGGEKRAETVRADMLVVPAGDTLELLATKTFSAAIHANHLRIAGRIIVYGGDLVIRCHYFDFEPRGVINAADGRITVNYDTLLKNDGLYVSTKPITVKRYRK